MDYEKKIEKLRNPYVRGNEGCSVSMIDLLEKINEIIDAMNGEHDPADIYSEDGRLIAKKDESEDERIRKWIIEELEITRDAMSGKNDYSDDPDIVARLKRLDEAIYWLEEQKELFVSMNPALGFDSGGVSVYHESEDEKIRKDIIGGLMWQRDNLKSEGPHDNNLILPGFCLTVGEHLKYLEKQKVNTEGDFGRGYDCGYQAGYAVAMNEMKPKVATATLDSEKQKELFESGKGLYYYDGEKTTYCGYPAAEDNPYDFAMEQQKEQKPVDDSDFKTKLAEYMMKNRTGYSYNISSESILELAKDELIKRGELQKPVEWSEEDEKIRRNLMSLLANMRGDRITEETYQKYYPWLSALRPQWKPTEEQMKALNAMNCYGELSYQGQQQLLIDLYQQLKKL